MRAARVARVRVLKQTRLPFGCALSLSPPRPTTRSCGPATTRNQIGKPWDAGHSARPGRARRGALHAKSKRPCARESHGGLLLRGEGAGQAKGRVLNLVTKIHVVVGNGGRKEVHQLLKLELIGGRKQLELVGKRQALREGDGPRGAPLLGKRGALDRLRARRGQGTERIAVWNGGVARRLRPESDPPAGSSPRVGRPRTRKVPRIRQITGCKGARAVRGPGRTHKPLARRWKGRATTMAENGSGGTVTLELLTLFGANSSALNCSANENTRSSTFFDALRGRSVPSSTSSSSAKPGTSLTKPRYFLRRSRSPGSSSPAVVVVTLTVVGMFGGCCERCRRDGGIWFAQCLVDRRCASSSCCTPLHEAGADLLRRSLGHRFLNKRAELLPARPRRHSL